MFLPNFGPFGDVHALVALAQEAEARRWDGLFIWDHILFDAEECREVVDPWVSLAAIASATSRIRLGALITPLARRRPWKLARETATLDQLSGGRLVLGAGLGFPPAAEFELFGEDGDSRRRAEKLDEGLEILDGLWSGEEFSFEGSHFTIGATRFLPTPVQRPRPPVWIAGWWPNKRPFRRAARWDGIFPELPGGELPSPQDLIEIQVYIGAHRTAQTPFDVVLNGYSDDDPAEAGAFIQPYRDAGLTWWLERVDPTRRFSIEEARRRIACGPPSIKR